jgi:2-polyprenyl-3-methyl-5-hydroxy-6-metoxy-1,4-benzoquinol methylase
VSFDDESGMNAVEMEEDAAYQRQLDLFVKSSTEKGIELVKIGEIIAGITRRRNFLNIGAGGGDLTIPVAQSFESTTIVEPNERQAQHLKRRSPHFHIVNSSWEKVDLGPQRFDFILCSHVLYYIEEGTWLTTIERMYEYLADKGCIAIVLQSPIGDVADFFSMHLLTTMSISLNCGVI